MAHRGEPEAANVHATGQHWTDSPKFYNGVVWVDASLRISLDFHPLFRTNHDPKSYSPRVLQRGICYPCLTAHIALTFPRTTTSIYPYIFHISNQMALARQTADVQFFVPKFTEHTGSSLIDNNQCSTTALFGVCC